MLEKIKVTPLLDTLRLEDISDEVYFGKKYSGYISNSRLSLINPEQGGSADKFIKGLAENNIYSDSLIFGSAVHELILQPDDFILIESVDRPTAKAGFMAEEVYHKSGKVPTFDELYNASQKIGYYAKSFNNDKAEALKSKCMQYWRQRALFEHDYKGNKVPIYLDPKSRDRLKGVLNSFNNNNKFIDLLHPNGLFKPCISKNERTILLDVKVEVPDNEPFIFHLKSKLDNFTIDEDSGDITVNDVKTTGKPINYFSYTFKKYRYYREMGMYGWLLVLCAKKFYDIDKPQLHSNCLVVETFGDYNTTTYELTKKDIIHGFNEFKTLLRLVAYYKTTQDGTEWAEL